ncbi:hypothetical protein MKW94_010729 [Papaver nudicaule]|uniref:B box-type domain-containing protein n=1 Tax=Papaver nudicaule TaxID=74823 RepID=A0AA41VQJ7_PAPNU|nr:hypothetical protein [Papaver nudicaule]
MKECELCEAPARMFCESDQASLCWDCDEKVHCANFLVARHTRSLLCHSCQSLTPWKASGSKLGPTISICERCVKRCNGNDQREEDNDDEESHKDGDDDDDEDQFHDADENDDNGDDMQIIKWFHGHLHHLHHRFLAVHLVVENLRLVVD